MRLCISVIYSEGDKFCDFLSASLVHNNLHYYSLIIIGIKHGFPCINVCQVPREMLKTEANVHVLENHI